LVGKILNESKSAILNASSSKRSRSAKLGDSDGTSVFGKRSREARSNGTVKKNKSGKKKSG
jgi:ApbE superfamily uncharacterized protein (UPF0280 family)